MIKDALIDELENSPVRTFLIDFIEVKDNDAVFAETPCAKSIIDFLSKKSRKLSLLENGKIIGTSDFTKADFIFSLEDPRFTRDLSLDQFRQYYELLEFSGKLIFSVMNSLGYSYISGESEMHTGSAFGGYSSTEKSESKTSLSRKELHTLLGEAGFKSIRSFYPVPDSIFPTEIFSDEFLPSEGDIHDVKRNYVENGMDLMKTDSFINNIINEGLFTNFANSFLVIAEK